MAEILRQFRRLFEIKSLCLFLYVFKAMMSVLMVLPFFVTFDSVLSPSHMAGNLIDSWDISVIVELLDQKGGSIGGLIAIIIVGMLIYLLLMQFINGGLYYAVVSRKFPRLNWREFFGECGVNFPAHLKITLLMMVVYSVLIPAGMFFVNIIGVAGGHLMGTPALIFTVFKLAVLLLILTAASIFSDSVRAALASYPDKKFRELLKVGADYFKPRLLKLLKVFLVTYIPFFLIWLLVEWLAMQSVNAIAGLVGIFLEFILFQMASAARTGQKLWYLIILGRDFRSVYPGRFIPEQAELKLET